jgi:CheY-like chemotaxis protein
LVDSVSRRRILVVEDEPLSAELVRVLLEDLDFEVDVASDGAEAVAGARDIAYDLILMDFFLPVMSGLEAVAAIRGDAEAASRSVPIIALTASDNASDHRACLDVGMNDYLLKPLGRDALSAMLMKCGVLGPDRAAAAASGDRPLINGFDPSRIEDLRRVMDKADFNAVIAQAVSSLDGHLAIIGREVEQRDDQRRAFHRIVSLSHDLGFISLGRRARDLEEALGGGETLEPPRRGAFIADAQTVLGTLRSMAETG